MVRTRAIAKRANYRILANMPVTILYELYDVMPEPDQHSFRATCKHIAGWTERDFYASIYRNAEQDYKNWLSNPLMRVVRSEPVKILLDATRAGDFAFLRKLLRYRSEGDARRRAQEIHLDINKAIKVACEKGDATMVRFLLQKWKPPFGYTDPTGRAYPGRRWIHLAAEVGHGEVVRVLLKFGYPPNATDDQDRTALGLAVDNDDVGMVARLVNYGADPGMARRGTKAKLRQLMNRAIRRGLLARDKFKAQGE